VKGILADVNIQGHVDALVVRMQCEPWKLFWDHLHLQYFHFADVGLAPDAVDSLVWETCQREELILITDNRNKNDQDSLEATIQTHNTPTSLPVFTIGNIPHLRASRDYADRVIDKLLDSLLGIDALRGTGRLYLP
jgi:predicted nuclease of predicted toxin-antitoxin system